MTIWFIETCMLADERTQEFRDACNAADVGIQTIFDVDQPNESKRKPPEPDASVIAYGSKSILAFAKARRWRPGVWTGSAFDYDRAHAGLGEIFLNASAVATTLTQADTAARTKAWPTIFIRPSNDDKAFAGQVIATEGLAEWRERNTANGYLSDPNLDVIIAPPQSLRREWRLIVAGGEIVAASLYREAGEKAVSEGCPEPVSHFAKQAHARYEPAPVFVMDVAELADSSLAIVELNAFNSADLYACNIANVVSRVTAVARH
ncbi:MAG: ATP-grasp domain-containing protein [Terricaulis sp.]